MRSSPAPVIRLPAIPFSRSYTSGCRPSLNRSTRSWTAVATLLTFCPPGPVAARKVSLSASSGMATSSDRIAPLAEGFGQRRGDVDHGLALARHDETGGLEQPRPAGNAIAGVAPTAA